MANDTSDGIDSLDMESSRDGRLLSTAKYRAIIAALKVGKSVRSIAMQVGVNRHTVSRTLQRHEILGTFTQKLKNPIMCKQCGARIKYSPCIECRIVEAMVRDGMEPKPDIFTKKSSPMGVFLCGDQRKRYEVLHERKKQCDKYDKIHYLDGYEANDDTEDQQCPY